ncbi:MAG: hypothetical protein U5K54_22450 [Cytophagales bacterium]|nr:hypothetical protein [Cytophagales bacterium]
MRSAFQFTDRFDYSQDYIDHGYKELHIPPGAAGAFKSEKMRSISGPAKVL